MTRKVLGRGLDALIPQVLAQPREAAYATPERPPDQISMVPIDRISANPHQPRSDFDPSRIEELAQSIREMGILEPLILRAVESGGYELIAGERRLRAAQVAGRTEVPALIRDFEGLRSLEVALVENLQREDLNPVDEAKAYQRLVEDFGRTHAEISKAVGKDRTTITNLLRLLRLPADVLQEVSRGTLSVGNARVLLSLTDPPQQSTLAQRIISEGWSVRQTERWVAKAERPEAPPKVKPVKPINEEVLRVQDALRYALGTEVRLFHSDEGGRIEIRYGSRDELERILDVMGVQVH